MRDHDAKRLAALRDSRTRAQDQDEAELEAMEDMLSDARDLLMAVRDRCPVVAMRLNDTAAADCLRRFEGALDDVLTEMKNARHDELQAAFQLVNPDCDAAKARAVASYETTPAE